MSSLLSPHLAEALRDAGLRWTPSPGDRFVIPQPELSGEVFTLSEMTIEAHAFPGGTVLGFNGTTEWALDSVAQEDTLWLPREDQLRELLGTTFVALERVPRDPDSPDGLNDLRDPDARDAPGDLSDPDARDAPGDLRDPDAPDAPDAPNADAWVVRTRGHDGTPAEHCAPTAPDAYALAVLALVESATSPVGSGD